MFVTSFDKWDDSRKSIHKDTPGVCKDYWYAVYIDYSMIVNSILVCVKIEKA